MDTLNANQCIKKTVLLHFERSKFYLYDFIIFIIIHPTICFFILITIVLVGVLIRIFI